MRSGLILIALSALATLPVAAGAAVSCPDRTPAAITKPALASAKCQEAIAKAGSKFVKTKLKALAKCKLTGPVSGCPTAADTLKIQTAATKSAASIATACGADSVQQGLTSSYGLLTDENVIGSCTLSQLNVSADLVSAETHGATTEAWPGTGAERANCVKTLSKVGTMFVDKAHKAVLKCLSGQIKLGTAGNLAPICVGRFSGGSFVPPTDPKATLALSKLTGKIEGLITSKCGPAQGLSQIATLFACPGAQNVGDLQQCVLCGDFTEVFDQTAAEYSENGTYVANGAGALQAAITGAGAGDKILLGSGNYTEEALISNSDLSIVGCGGATDNRPRLLAPAVQTVGRGIRAADVNDLTFQSLEIGPDTTCGTPPCPGNYSGDGIFISGGNNLVFRDIVGNGGRTSRYAVFPVRSNNILIELCTVRDIADAGIYVGQSSTITVRYNDVRGSVAGTEFENCGNGQGYGNYATDNTGGMLVFLDGSLEIQVSDCHQIHHNLFESNNKTNYGLGTVSGVPDGTGLLIISNDTTPVSYNICRGNDTFGLALVDETAAGFDVSAVDPNLNQNYIFNNWLTNNGNNQDTSPPNNSPVAGDLIGIALDPQFGNCIDSTSNIFNTTTILMPFGDPLATSNCANVPSFGAACPAPAVTSSTTTTPTTSTTSTTVFGSASSAFLD